MSERSKRYFESLVQIHLTDLENQGLFLEDVVDSANERKKAIHYITRIGIQRFSEYFLALRSHLPEEHRSKVPLNDVLRIYKFDRRLRLLFLDALERIEVTARTLICEELELSLGAGLTWLTGLTSVLDDRLRKEVILNTRRTIKTVSNSVPEALNAEHFPHLVSSVTFGQMSKLFEYLPKEKRQQIAGLFSMTPEQFGTCLYALTHVRNDAAHHMMFWCKRYRTKPRQIMAIELKYGYVEVENEAYSHVFGYAMITYFMVCCVARNTTWHKRLMNLMNSNDLIPDNLDLYASMKFPKGWEEMPIWAKSTGSKV